MNLLKSLAAVSSITMLSRILGYVRDTIMAPPGYKLVVADLSNIELRMCHYLCGETATMEALRQPGLDGY